ncbi:Activator of HSP90 ATPase 1 family protein (fragment) [Burkholderiales bacterium]
MHPKDFDTGALADVTCLAGDGRSTLVFVRDLPHAPQEVWATLTEPAQLCQWAPFTPDRSLAAVGPATLQMTDDGRTQRFAASVLRADPPKLLESTPGAMIS